MTSSFEAQQSWNKNPRMIERWFPCAEVSVASDGGWGSGNSEANLFIWFAKRPLAQARAAVVTSLLPWPDDEDEQRRLQDLVRLCLTGYDAGHDELVAELACHYPDGASMLDPFSGRAMIPLEAARYGIKAWGIDYSPVATLAGQLLADYPLRDWDSEPSLPIQFQRDGNGRLDIDADARPRLLRDVETVLEDVGRRWALSMQDFYPRVNGKQPWGYLWAVTLPCQECGRRFPLTGSLVLRHPLPKDDDTGQSYRITARSDGTWGVDVHAGSPQTEPTMRTIEGKPGKSAVCIFCGHAIARNVHVRLMQQHQGEDALLVVADIDDEVGKSFRLPTDAEKRVLDRVAEAVAAEPPLASGIPAVPDEVVPIGNGRFMTPLVYGATTFADFCNTRQTLSFVRLARAVGDVARDLYDSGISPNYVQALCGYAGSVVVRKLRRSTRGGALQARKPGNSNRVYMSDIFMNEAAIAFNYDYFETGIGNGPGTWLSVGTDTISALRKQLERAPGRPATVQRGSALALPMPSDRVDTVVTDPPYDEMIPYSDSSDLFFVWLKRALAATHPELAITSDPRGVQEKHEEIIVKRTTRLEPNEHRTREFYDAKIAEAFAEANRVVKPDGVVTIVFGHGDPDVWKRLLTSIDQAGLVLTGSWPAQTEKGGKAGYANIVATLTLSCRPAPPARPEGRVAEVDAEVRREIGARITIWETAGLALTDQLMAAAGPAMEVVGRYSRILDKRGTQVDIARYLPLARRAVEEVADIRIDSLPLGTFDVRTRFALFWSRLFGRAEAPASEARWQRLASDLDEHDTHGILTGTKKGVRLTRSDEVDHHIDDGTSLFNVALAMAAARKRGLADVAEIVRAASRDSDDEYLWACIRGLAAHLPDADSDGESWTWLVRHRRAVVAVARDIDAARRVDAEVRKANPTIFDINQLFPEEGTLFSQGDHR